MAGFLILKILTWYLYQKYPIHFFSEILFSTIYRKNIESGYKVFILVVNSCNFDLKPLFFHLK